jgi:signal transduction histidine kinase
MPESEVIIFTFTAIIGLLLLLLTLIVVPLLSFSKRRVADQILIRQLEDKYDKELLKSQLEVQEQTLEHMSREIHDNIGSSISIAKAFLISDNSPEEKIKNATELLRKALEDLRDMSKGLSLEAIRAGGLTTAIEGLVAQVKKIGKFVVSYEVIGNYNFLEEQIEIIAFRILQESVNNIIRHAEATTIDISMICKPESICLHITDDGKGFNIAGAHKPGGLVNMRTRAALIDATFKIEQPLNGGTKISLCIPLTSIQRK